MEHVWLKTLAAVPLVIKEWGALNQSSYLVMSTLVKMEGRASCRPAHISVAVLRQSVEYDVKTRMVIEM